MAGQARGRGEAVPVVHHRFRHRPWACGVSNSLTMLDLLPRHSGDCCRAADPAVAKSVAQQLSAGETLYRPGRCGR